MISAITSHKGMDTFRQRGEFNHTEDDTANLTGLLAHLEPYYR
jgi:hypothetical protein